MKWDLVDVAGLVVLLTIALVGIFVLKHRQEGLQARVTALEAQIREHEGYHMAGGDPPFIETRRTVKPRVR